MPTLTVVSGPPGAGKTTLAHALARRIGCPAIVRDTIKEGMTFTARDRPSSEPNARANAAFFDVLQRLLSAGSPVVAEAAFQDKLWRPQLAQLTDIATVKAVRGHLARRRDARRRHHRRILTAA